MKHGKPKSFSKRPHGKPDYKKSGDARPERSARPERGRRPDREPARDNDRDKKKSFEKKPFEKKTFEKKPFEKKPAERKVFEPQPRREREPQSVSARLSGPLLWGFHAVRAAWLNPDRRIIRLLATDAALGGFKDTQGETTLKRPNPEIIDKGAFERMMPPGAVHQGIAALVENLPQRDAHDLISSLGPEEKAVILILDQVTDPHNVGAILRSAAAFGAKGLIVQDRHAPEITGTLAKVASGAADVIPMAYETNLSRAIELLQENDFVVIGLDERGGPIGDLPQHNRLALVLGAEGSGLRKNVADHCDGLVSLPTEGAIRSLNVSNAAAVALYAIKTR